MKVVAMHADKTLLEDSAEKLGYDFLWVYRRWRDFVDVKIGGALSVLPDLDSDIVMFSDSDCLLLRSPLDVLDIFSSMHSPIVISAEKVCYPLSLEDRFPVVDTMYRFPNSGGIIGYKDELLAAYQWLNSHYEEEKNDQGRWQLAYGSIPMRIDHRCEIFQTMSDDSRRHLDWDGRLLRNIHTDSYPCHVHFNGRMGGIEDYYRRRFE